MTAQPDTEGLLEAALFWAAQDVPVFPLVWPVDGRCSCGRETCKSPGKHPLAAAVPNGLTDASTDAEAIRRWWTRWPNANLGVRTGYAFDVVDIDGEVGAESFQKAAEKHGSPYHLGDVRTGREDAGLHLLVTPGGQKNETGGLAGMPPGVDVRGRGGYIVAPPSVHVSGHRYEWLSHFRDGVILGSRDWPEWIAAVKADGLAAKGPTSSSSKFHNPAPFVPAGDAADAYGQAVLRRAVGLVESSFEGSRWQTLALEAIPLVARAADGGCLDLTEGIEALEKAAQTVGLDVTETRRIRPLAEGMIARGIRNPIRPTGLDAPLQSFATEEEATHTGWEPPEALTREVPPFPVETLGWLAEPILEVSRRFQTPPDLAAMMTLALASACVRGRGRVQAVPGWEEPMNLFLAVVLASGETKSPLVAVILRRLREVEREAQAAAGPMIAAAQDLAAVHENALRKAIADASKNPGAEVMAELLDARKRMDDNRVPVRPLFLAGDMTPEAMVKLLADQNGVLAHISAEGGILDTMIGGRYSSGQAQVTDLLNAHDGREPIKVHRKSAEDLIVEDPCLTLALAVQPQVLEALGANDVAMRRGLHARFLFAIPRSLIGSRDMSLTVTSLESDAAFGHLTDAVLGAFGGLQTGDSGVSGRQSLRYEMSPLSSSLLIQYRRHLEPRRHKITGDLGDLGAWVNKLDGQVVRLAALLQMIRDVDPRSTSSLHGFVDQKPHYSGVRVRTIEPEAVADAIMLADYFVAHATEAFDLMGADTPDLLDARRLLGWIRNSGRLEFTVRDAWQANKNRTGFRDTAAVEAAVAVLAARGWVWPVPPEPREGKPGRPPSPKFLVHPDAFRAE